MKTFGICLLVIFIISCNKKQISFSADIQPLLSERCVGCHGDANPAGKIVLTSYDSLMSSRAFAHKTPIVVPGNASESWLYLRTGTNQMHYRMPPDTTNVIPLTQKEVLLIGKWIQEGAKNN